MIPHILLDPGVFWLLDPDDHTESETENVILRAMQWLKLEPIKGVRVFFSNLMLERLSAAGYFPAEPHLRKVIERANLSHVISARELAANISRFLSNAMAIEDRGPVTYGLFANTRLDPNIFCEIQNLELLDLSQVTACLMAANCEFNSSDQDDLVYGYNRSNTEFQRIALETNVTALDPTELEIQIGERLAREISVLSVPSAYSHCLNALTVWRTATTAAELRWAIQIEAERLSRTAGQTSVRQFLIGTEFLRLLREHQCLGDGQYSALVLTKCSQLVADLGNVEVHDFRSRDIDGAVGKRVHLTGSHEALRLMFWSREGEVIEFAAVRTKFDLLIDEGVPDLAI